MGGSCPECGLLLHAIERGVRVDGNCLVIRGDAILPYRCVKTNDEIGVKPIKKTLSWAHPAIYLLLLVNLLVLFIVYLIVRKRCTITFFLNQTERNKQRLKMGLAVLVLIASIATIVIGTGLKNIWIGAGGLVVFFVSLIFMVAFSSPIFINKYKNGEFWIKGCGRTFLDSICAETSVR